MNSSTSGRSFDTIAPTLGKDVYIDPFASVIGDVHLGDDVSVWPFASIRGDMHKIRIGARTSVQDNAILHITHASDYNPDGWPLIIGEDVTIGHGVCLHGCIVGSRVLLGIGSIILDGAVIEDEVVIGAGSLVPPRKTLERGHLYLGNPAKPVRRLTDNEIAFFRYSAQNYIDLKNKYLASNR